MSTSKVYLPSDPLFPAQWHLLNQGNTEGSVAGYDINVISVWPDYTGRGVLIGVLDDGIDETHPDLIANFRRDLAWDVNHDTPGAAARNDDHDPLDDDNHGTAVAGLAAATANNGIGGVGVAWGSAFTMYRQDLNTNLDRLALSFQLAAEKQVADGVDISTNSWGPDLLIHNRPLFDAYQASGRYMAETGREGLGIIALFASGNARGSEMNANYDPTDNSPWHIVVAASDQAGGITSYSTPGAAVLVTAPGSDNPDSMVTTDRQGVDGYNKAPGATGNYEGSFNGTSAAAPVAAGVVALVLEANAGLGYRDVQEILAYSAKRATFLNREFDHAFNGAGDWNGGALLVSHDFGHGHIDAHAAVRLAESWMKLGTAANLVQVAGTVGQHSLSVGAGEQATASTIFAPNYRLEQMTLTIAGEANDRAKILIELIAPDGTVSRLMDNKTASAATEPFFFDDKPLVFDTTFNTVLNWGADLAGEWVLKVSNTADTGTVNIHDWSMLAFTAGAPGGGTQIFTDEFAAFAALQPERLTLNPAQGDTLNASAVTADIRFDLAGGGSRIGDTAISLTDARHFSHLVSGDGNDILVGNSASNILMAGRGDNHLDGGAGLDTARLIGERSGYELARHDGVLSVHSTALAGGGVDTLHNIELLHFADQVVLVDTPLNLGADLFDEASYRAQNPDVAAAIGSGDLASGKQHYQWWGAAEGRNPNALFDEQGYLARYADVAAAVDNGSLASGFAHYLAWGWAEERAPSVWMDTTAYLADNPDVAAAQMNPLQHYLSHGVHEGRAITALDTGMWF